MRPRVTDYKCWWIGVLWRKFMIPVELLCSFFEIHSLKIVSFAGMTLCCLEVNSLHMVLVTLFVLGTIFGNSALQFLLNIISPFLSLLFLLKMMYQTKFIQKNNLVADCKNKTNGIQTTVEKTISDPEWWGFVLYPQNEPIYRFYILYIIVIHLFALRTIILIRQKVGRLSRGESLKTPNVMFYTINRRNADVNLKECLMYMFNYGFFKFGIEVLSLIAITLSFCVFVIAFRKDVFSVLYAIWIIILFLPSRPTLYVIWPFFMTTLAFSILWQYMVAVGFSKKACFEYPWAEKETITTWMFLPSFTQPPKTHKTLGTQTFMTLDFVLLILIQRQLAVFDLERKYGLKFLGGNNKEIYLDYYRPDFRNPTPDHTDSIKNWLDVVKFFLMRCLFRITLAVEFWNGASNTNILSLGYLVVAFVFLWIDYDLCLWHLKKILKWWNITLGYCVFVIFIKSVLEFVGCVYEQFLTSYAPWIVDLLYLTCSEARNKNYNKSSGLSFYWDVACFTFIIFQRRYFKSYYFLHEVDDAAGVLTLQAMGAKLMASLDENTLRAFQIRERRTLMKIKRNMNRIKAWQKRMQGQHYNEPNDHTTATYMGDYFMFDELEEDSPTSVDDSSTSSEEALFEEDVPKSTKPVTMSEFLERKLLKRLEEESIERKDPQTAKTGTKRYALAKIREGGITPGPKFTLKKEETEKDANLEKDKRDRCVKILKSFLDSCMVSIIKFFTKHSRDYRYIESMMREERKLQKEIKKETRAFRKQRLDTSLKKKRGRTLRRRTAVEPGLEDNEKRSTESISRDEKGEAPIIKGSQGLLVKLINAMYMFVMSKTELLCYIIIFIHTVLSPTLISLPLPLLVFFWGSLTTVRPTITFWTVLIAYTEVSVVIKTLFQNPVFPWNIPRSKKAIRPDNPSLFVGINGDNRYVIADLFLLLILFLHRYKLKTLGLWSRTHEEETQLPQNLRVYKELPSEKDIIRRTPHDRKKKEIAETDSFSTLMQMAAWRCTSKATGKIVYWGSKIRTKIQIKEIEGPILVTSEGRRLKPTPAFLSQQPEENLTGNIVLRVYIDEIVPESKNLFYRLSWIQHFTSLRKFFIQIFVQDWRVSSDFYTLMFIFEFLDFLLVFFGYSSFTDVSPALDDEHFNLSDSQIPLVYLFTMIAHFIVIIIDRALYLRKNVIGKLFLQFILVILVHVWMFIIVPVVTESPLNSLYIPQTYYMISCFYFLMSAYQLRVGYPMRVQGHFLCRKYGYLNYYAFKSLQMIPFFNQLRTLLDFNCISSSMTMTEWIKMESMYQLIYENKCKRRADIYYPMPRGQECPKDTKYPLGVIVFTAMIFVIWLPFIIFALFNTVAQANTPEEARLNLQIEGIGYIYESKITEPFITSFTADEYRTFHSLYKDNKKIYSFMSQYDKNDVAVLKFKTNSFHPWVLTPVEHDAFNRLLLNVNNNISLYMGWQVQRSPRALVVSLAKGHHRVVLPSKSKAKKKFSEIAKGSNPTIFLENLLPKFIQVTNDGEAKPIKGFMISAEETNPYRNATLSFLASETAEWWQLAEVKDDELERNKISKIPHHDKNLTVIYSFNEKNIPKLLHNVSKKGIIGLYLSIVFFMWTFIKRLMLKYPYIIFDDMPNPDPVLKLCHDIYLARENREFTLEEDLYAKLLFLFRSPETLIKVTRLVSAPMRESEI